MRVSVAVTTLLFAGHVCSSRRPAVPLPPAVPATSAEQLAETDVRLVIGRAEDITYEGAEIKKADGKK